LLGIELFEEDRDVIDAAANRVMSYLKDLATGDEAAHSQELLNEISRARICLLNREKKAAYDAQLREKLKADGLLGEALRKPRAKKPPPKLSKASGPPPAKPPTAAPPPLGTVAPPVGTTSTFPVLDASAQQRPAVELVNVAIQTEDEQKNRAADPSETAAAANRDQGKYSRSLLALLAGLLLLLVVAPVIALVYFGGSEEPRPKSKAQASGTRTNIAVPSPVLGPATSGKELPGLPTSFESTVVDGFTGGFGRMVGHWAFDDDTEDDSGNGNHGTLVGNPAFTDGRLGRALRLAAGQRFEVHRRLFPDSSEFSVAFWARLDSIPTATTAFLNGGGLAVYLQSGYLQLRVGQSDPLVDQNTSAQTNGLGGIDLARHVGQWTHLTIVYSAPARLVHYYVNGERQGYQQYSERTPAEMGQMVISNVAGTLDDVRIFDYRLSNEDVKAIYDGSFQPLRSAPAEPNGSLVCETWFDVPPDLNRRQIERITVQPADETTVVRNWIFRRLPRGGSNYLLNRIRGFLYPPDDGEYAFTLRGSGGAMMFLQQFGSNDDSLTRIIVGDPLRPSTSPPISLQANRAYYFELVEQCESTRYRSIRVVWKHAEDPLPRPIPLTRFASYGEAD
jgi:hypothetical protein